MGQLNFQKSCQNYLYFSEKNTDTQNVPGVSMLDGWCRHYNVDITVSHLSSENSLTTIYWKLYFDYNRNSFFTVTQ